MRNCSFSLFWTKKNTALLLVQKLPKNKKIKSIKFYNAFLYFIGQPTFVIVCLSFYKKVDYSVFKILHCKIIVLNRILIK